MSASFHNKILRVNLTDRTVRVDEPGAVYFRRYMGGWNIIADVLLKEVPVGADPLGPENKLIFAPGVLTGLAIAGVHPVISIATAQGVLAPLAPDPNLLGITYLMAWGTGVAISPFSGMHLGMQGRFGIDARGFLRWNASFTLVMLLIHGLVLQIYERVVMTG